MSSGKCASGHHGCAGAFCTSRGSSTFPKSATGGRLRQIRAVRWRLTLAREARRQNIHEKHAADFITALDHVSAFEKLLSAGPNALYLNRDGQLVTRRQLGGAPKPSKSLDFRWKTAGIVCLAAQKYTKEGGGNQDSQFNELEQLLRNYLQRTNNGMALFVLVDGAYYTEERVKQLNALVRTNPSRSYVASVNTLQGLLHDIAIGS